MSEELFSLRAATSQDIPTLDAYAAAEGMGPIPDIEHVFVAQNTAKELIGFIRLAFDNAGVCHVNPVVVCSTWRGYGVGRALMDCAASRFGELRLVSRGSSRSFYEALGFTPLAWDAIKPEIAAECDGCELYDECGPTPMSSSLSESEY